MNISTQELTAQCGSTFIIHTQSGMLKLTLMEVRERERRGLPSQFRTPVSMVFEGPPDVEMIQDLYYLDHPVLGRMQWMLVPILRGSIPNPTNAPLYEVILA